MSTASVVRRYIEARPALQEAMSLGVINYSALARRIAEETGVDGDMAVQAACRRYRPPPLRTDERLQELLSRAQLDVRTRMSVITTRQSWSIGRRTENAQRAIRDAGGTAHVVHGSEAVTIITDTDHVQRIREALEADEILDVRKGLAQVNVRTRGAVADVPGVLVRVAGALSNRGINFVDVLSCHKDNLFLISEDDLSAALDAMGPVLHG